MSKNFENIVDLCRHMIEELVDDPDSCDINSTYTGVTGAIEVVGPSDEIGRIMGSKKQTIFALETITNAVASKYGFRVMINVMNETRRDELLEREKDVE